MFKNYDQVISLGYICNVPSYLKNANLRNKAYPFDRVATPMWAVYELIVNNFDQFLENLESKKLFIDNDDEFVVDTKYYTRLSIHKQKFIDKLKEATKRRIGRFNDVLSDQNKSVLFVRLEEPEHYDDLGDRIMFDEYTSKYENDEKYYLVKLSDFLKNKYPNLNFKILFMSASGEFTDPEHNIVGIQKPDIANYRERKGISKIKQTFLKNKQVL